MCNLLLLISQIKSIATTWFPFQWKRKEFQHRIEFEKTLLNTSVTTETITMVIECVELKAKDSREIQDLGGVGKAESSPISLISSTPPFILQP